MEREKELIKAIEFCDEAIEFLDKHKELKLSGEKLLECRKVLEEELINTKRQPDSTFVLSGNAKLAVGWLLFILKTYMSFKD